MVQSKKVAIVTGSSSGIGYATALDLAKNGFKTYATMRDTNKSKNILAEASKDDLPIKVLQLDVNDDSSVQQAVHTILKEDERIDVLVNNAGFTIIGAVEDTSVDEAKEQFETNFFSLYRVVQQVLPTMRKQRSGIIINISSIGGFLGISGLSAYVSSKFAMEGFSECLKAELEPFGIKVAIVEPGPTKTNAANSYKYTKNSQLPSSAFAEVNTKMKEMSTYASTDGGDPPEVVSKEVLNAVLSSNPDTRYPVSPEAKLLFDARRTKNDADFEQFVKEQFSPKQ